jgi:RNA 2',3'-cyclic 3'-phosphodiesterase
MTSPGTVEGDERMRLFIALRLPGQIVDALVAWQGELGAADARTIPRENLHVTVAFLGSRAAADVEPVLAELREASGAARPIVLSPRDYRETPRVGMLRLKDRDLHAHDFAQDVGRRLALRGLYEPEARRWLPHVTVLRFKTPPHLRPELPALGEFSPSDAALYHSVLRPSGAQYAVIESAALGG